VNVSPQKATLHARSQGYYDRVALNREHAAMEGLDPERLRGQRSGRTPDSRYASRTRQAARQLMEREQHEAIVRLESSRLADPGCKWL
jgi:hypothetical protein